MRSSEIKRKTAETNITLSLSLDGTGASKIDSGCGFLDHMLTLFAKHGRFDLNVKCKGDVQVDYHHTVEDIGICLGQAFEKALGDKKGIVRYGNFILPMDEALILTAVDLSGRSFLVKELDIKSNKVGDFDTELVEEFLLAFTRTANCTLHVRQLSGSNAHHIIEGVFKSLARSLKAAVKIDADAKNEIPSTKGVL
ncbi:MAG: imidazoleglycerol-phosphate dehydratase HisB [Clostridia bacterium]|nr:imidazoleglycerol-phosphate dehydratase HisB [Clostridia bacterium]MBR2449004.1 imidazoleglycerol-phosphate dehydratase HisB [Clostridia bacterium]